jgi:hypothetical protein
VIERRVRNFNLISVDRRGNDFIFSDFSAYTVAIDSTAGDQSLIETRSLFDGLYVGSHALRGKMHNP